MTAQHRVLVVDDDASGRRLTRATLKKAGFGVIEAADGQLALDLLRAELPDLVLMDVSMPVMDGFTACQALRQLPGGGRIPVVMMTGLDDVQSIQRAFEVGATDFITKPINWTILSHRVRYMLRASAAINDLKENQRRLSNAQRIGEMGDWEWDVRRDRVVPSDQAWRILGSDPAVVALSFEAFVATAHPDDAAGLRQLCEHALTQGDGFALDHRIVHPDGTLHHVHQQVEVTQRDQAGRATSLIGAVHDISRHKLAEEQIRQLAYYDPLTGLPNRRLFTDQLEKSLGLAERHQWQAAVMFVDLDNFKRVNDTLGHGAGDDLLRVVSTRLTGSLRGHDAISHRGEDNPANSIARLGGDEFIVLLGDLQRPSDAASVARRLVAALAQPVTLNGTEVFVGGSIGVALYPQDGTDVDTLLMNADTAMYRAKEAGRGVFRFYDRSMNDRSLDRLQMEAMLRRALERHEFVLHYQPRLDVESGAIVGAEALVRWQHAERGLVMPGEFIPLMEDSGLVIPIGEWAIDEACRQIAAWQSAGLPAISVAVNLTSSHLRERALPELVQTSLRRHGVMPSCLEIEVTESILLSDAELSLQVATRLFEMGVRLSIDDFGTGYSSLSYLKRLPINALKIDRSFVRDLVTDPDDAAIVTAIIAMAHSLKLKVVAEGVETQAQLAYLRDRGCDEYQGFLTSRALPADAFAALYASRQRAAEQLPTTA